MSRQAPAAGSHGLYTGPPWGSGEARLRGQEMGLLLLSKASGQRGLTTTQTP